ncbi:hypothetical protein [Acinetobacter pollinis]|uniref:hypothetical protein n=1 Tax=Acinetobacter pollinis TaxID=2605270 RepID=UPI0018A2C03D|nr:hypothetical protein [Acinetobacter pollinis]MBF7691545.1 hypothetical protein [Acinetobacter pollinis]MBF7699314.1 hypothetical protein [Acinetobacter pollinis]
MKKILVVFLSLGMLTACKIDFGSSDNSSPSSKPNTPVQKLPPQQESSAQKIAKMEDSGELPRLERENTIQGIDNDGNGIRDDIDAYIKRTYPQKQQKAVSQYARALQASLLVNLNDRNALQRTSDVESRAVSCIFEKIPNGESPSHGRVVMEILGVTTNTKKRLMAYLALSKALDGTVMTLPNDGVCDE